MVIQENQSARAWIRLPSGGRLDLVNPDPHAWTNSDLAVKLSRTPRWGGESAWPNPLSVAQHSLTVLALRRMTAPERLTPAHECLELLHDAEEGFLGFDCISPLKALLGEPFGTVSECLSNAIRQRYRLPTWMDADYAAHKCADLIAAATEAAHCVGWSLDEIRSDLQISSPILATDPLAAIYDCRPWEPWPADVAAARFLAELESLLPRYAAHEAAAHTLPPITPKGARAAALSVGTS